MSELEEVIRRLRERGITVIVPEEKWAGGPNETLHLTETITVRKLPPKEVCND